MSIGRRDVWMSWDDVGLVVMGPRSDKADLWALTFRHSRSRRPATAQQARPR